MLQPFHFKIKIRKIIPALLAIFAVSSYMTYAFFIVSDLLYSTVAAFVSGASLISSLDALYETLMHRHVHTDVDDDVDDDEKVFDSISAKKGNVVDDKVFSERLIDLSNLTFDQKKAIAKAVAEDIFYQFLETEKMEGLEIVVQELKDSINHKIFKGGRIRPPTGVMLTIPEYVKRRRPPMKPIETVPVSEKVTIPVKASDAIEVTTGGIVITGSKAVKPVDVVKPVKAPSNPLPEMKPAKAVEKPAKAIQKPQKVVEDPKPAKMAAKTPARSTKPAKQHQKIVSGVKPASHIVDAPVEDDFEIRDTDDFERMKEEDDDDDESPDLDPDVKAQLKKIDQEVNDDDDFI